jgi:HAD superfamily hydrolase (TIGR01509 family)
MFSGSNELHLLFDLDGTLVNTDFVYIEVWKELLNKYNILVNNEFFNNFIKGKSDIAFLNYLLPKLTREDIKKISIEKDKLFIEKLNNYDEEILLDGVLDFFEKNKERQIAIVTSCNKSAAEFILKKTTLDKFVNILIASEDCSKHKPNPEPYLNAIKELNLKQKDCIIFEDSYSGYISAKNTGVYKIYLIINDESCDDIKNADEFKIKDYKKLNITEIIKDEIIQIENDEYILDNLYKILRDFSIKNITKNNSNLKTGYICDIVSYNLKYKDNTNENIILKISNFDNELSKTAIELNMYKNEKYFYTNIYPLIININIPRFFGSFEVNNKDGIILENLNKYSGTFNINLNKNIDLLLKVVNNIFNMHNKFYFENSNDKIDSMKNLLTVNQISYYSKLICNRFNKFMQKNTILLTENNKTNLEYIYHNFNKILDEASMFPLSFCHGDLKSPNIFYKDNITPYFLDWQYIHLNKGISDIVFLLVESIDFDKFTVDIVIKYYYKLMIEHRKYSYEQYLKDFKNALCIFPFFVCVWFNSEDNDKLLDPVFPIRFMKNLLKYYDFYL